MKFSLSACVLALSFLSTAHAACHQRSRRSYGAALIPTEHQTNKERDLRRAVKQVVRRHKSGRRADLERRQPGNLRQTYEDRASGGSWWDGPASSSTGGSQAVNLADTGANSWSSSASASAATGSATAAPSTSSSAPAASSSSSSSSSSGSYSGQATFFYRMSFKGGLVPGNRTDGPSSPEQRTASPEPVARCTPTRTPSSRSTPPCTAPAPTVAVP